MKNENLHEKAQKKYGGISEEELKKLKTKVEKKRKSYNSPQDIITVFAIFAILALTCVLLSFIDRNPESLIGSSGAAVTQRRHEEAKQVSYVVTGIIGAVSISVIALFAWSMKKRKKREAREFELRELKRLQLEAARKRVANARRDPQLMPNLSELERRQIMRKYSLDDRLDYDGKDYKDISEDLDYDIEGLLAQYGEIDEDAGFFDRIKQFFRKIFRRKKA
ncbi:MAG: hypothetical protein K1W00_03860 [Lachnospiraceae bacterium]